MLSTALCVQSACILEATARKPGNVHRFIDFDDLEYIDFLLSAAAIAPVLDAAGASSIGAVVRDAIRATRRLVATNTNLGIVLLLAPLAAVPRGRSLRAGVEIVLRDLTRADAVLVYEAIRRAEPGGMGKVSDQDIHVEPTQTLREVMARAADRDMVARQYANGFQELFNAGVPVLQGCQARHPDLETAIIECHLTLMALYPDSLIARKRGAAEAEEASRRARHVLDAGWPATEAGRDALIQLDGWLRELGNQRNPGTTADLVTACLFAALRDDTISLPGRFQARSPAAGDPDSRATS